MTTLLIVVASLLYAELAGYWVHVLLHSYAIPAISREHMNHHLLSYGPGKRMHSEEYIQEVTEGSWLVLGLGLEWIIPSGTLLSVTIFFQWLIGMSWIQIGVSVTVILTYVFLLFSAVHTQMHLRRSGLLRIPFVRNWFRRARKLHDIHHHHVTDEGLMNVNYGIALPIFDILFGSYLRKLPGLNPSGIARAKERLREKG